MRLVRTGGLVFIVIVASAWLVQQVELVYGGPHLAGGVYPATLILPAIPIIV